METLLKNPARFSINARALVLLFSIMAAFAVVVVFQGWSVTSPLITITTSVLTGLWIFMVLDIAYLTITNRYFTWPKGSITLAICAVVVPVLQFSKSVPPWLAFFIMLVLYAVILFSLNMQKREQVQQQRDDAQREVQMRYDEAAAATLGQRKQIDAQFGDLGLSPLAVYWSSETSDNGITIRVQKFTLNGAVYRVDDVTALVVVQDTLQRLKAGRLMLEGEADRQNTDPSTVAAQVLGRAADPD